MTLWAGLAAALAVLAAPAAAHPPHLDGTKSDTDLNVHVLDVGQGNCVIVECPGGLPILNDCGSSSATGAMTSEEVHRYVSAVLAQYKGEAEPLVVIASHPHADHVNLISDPTYGVKANLVAGLYYSETLDRYSAPFQAWARNIRIKAGFNRPDYRIPFLTCGRAKIDIVAVNANPGTESANTDSVVLRIRYANLSVYLTGDGDGVTQQAVLQNTGNAKADIILALHHGADTHGSNDADWVAATEPQAVFFSAGYHNRYRHPRCTTVDNYAGSARLAAAQSHSFSCGADRTATWDTRTTTKMIYSTAASGALRLTIGPKGEVTLRCNERAC